MTVNPAHVADARAARDALDRCADLLGGDIVRAHALRLVSTRDLRTIGPVEMACRELAQRLPAGDPARRALEEADAAWWRMAQRVHEEHPGMMRGIIRQHAHKRSDRDAQRAIVWHGYHRACVRWDPERGVPLHRYCSQWASAGVRRSARRSSIVHATDWQINHALAAEKLRKEGATDEEIREELGLTPRQWALVAHGRPILAHHAKGAEGGTPAHESDHGETVAAMTRRLDLTRACEEVLDIIDALPPREREVLLEKSGGDTNADVGRVVGLSRERVRQVLISARRLLMSDPMARECLEVLQ